MYQRNLSNDGAGYYTWINSAGTDSRYTSTPTPSVGDNTYTNTALTSGAKAITAIDNRTHEITLDVEFAAYARYSDGDSGSAYAWKHGSDILYTDTTSITAETTKAYSDTALTTEVGTIALYDADTNVFAMCGSVAFHDSSQNIIVPLQDVDIAPGDVICYCCRWSSLQSQWQIMPVPMTRQTSVTPPSPSGGLTEAQAKRIALIYG